MKIRSGFVSNSSSSSFVVIDTRSELITYSPTGQEQFEGFGGTTEFGWGPETCRDFGSRVNFAYLQTLYGQPEWLDMLRAVIEEQTGLTKINWNITRTYGSDSRTRWGYIDHQSSASEGENTEIFDDSETLTAFLFGANSKVVLDNDNH